MKCSVRDCNDAFTTTDALHQHKQDIHGHVPVRRPRTNTTAVTAAAGGSGRTRSRRQKAPRGGSTLGTDVTLQNTRGLSTQEVSPQYDDRSRTGIETVPSP